MILDPGMCWGSGANGVWTRLDEMPLPGWLKPPSPMAQAVPSRDSVWKSSACLSLCLLSCQHLSVSGKFSGNVTKWQQTGPGADKELGQQKNHDVSIHTEDCWIKLKIVAFVLLKHQISLCLHMNYIYMVWHSFTQGCWERSPRQCKADWYTGSVPLPTTGILQTLDASGETNVAFCCFFSIPALGHPQFPLLLMSWTPSCSHPQMCK